MIDFTNGSIIKLRMVNLAEGVQMVAPLLIQGEDCISAYRSIRDMVIFTNKRIISINVQGITGKKKDYTSLPYSKINAFSIETSGTFDFDSELEMYFSGLGKVKFEFTGNSNVVQIGQLIATFAL